jgi:hypothetical protein
VLKFIGKIDAMLESLNEMKGFTFYSCSLLLIYDERFSETCDFEEVQVKLIDFANVVYSEEGNEPDKGLVQGLKNIKAYFQTLYENEKIVVNFNI